MNKSQFIEKIANKTGKSKTVSGELIDAFISVVTETIKSGEEIGLTGFGKFCVKDQPATNGRNPRTGEPIKIPARRLPKFKPGKGLKDSVN